MGNEKREETLPQGYESPCWIFKWSHQTNDLFKLKKNKIQFCCAYGNQRTEKISGGGNFIREHVSDHAMNLTVSLSSHMHCGKTSFRQKVLRSFVDVAV